MPANLSDADRRNGWQFRQRIFMRAQSVQLGNQPGGQNWKGFAQPTDVIGCIYGRRNDRALFSVEKPIERLIGQQLPNVATWSKP